jgi:hypothetical protein
LCVVLNSPLFQFIQKQLVGEKANRRFSSHLGRVVGIRSLPAPHLAAEMGLTINALPHTFVLSDKLLAQFHATLTTYTVIFFDE